MIVTNVEGRRKREREKWRRYPFVRPANHKLAGTSVGAEPHGNNGRNYSNIPTTPAVLVHVLYRFMSAVLRCSVQLQCVNLMDITRPHLVSRVQSARSLQEGEYLRPWALAVHTGCLGSLSPQ